MPGESKQSWGDVVQAEKMGRTMPSWSDEVSGLGQDSEDEYKTQVIGPDSEGNKTVIEYVTEDDGKIYKVTRTSKVREVTRKVNKAVAARKQWKKFGKAADDCVGPDPKTTVVGENVPLKLSFRQSLAEEEAQESATIGAKVPDKLVTCRICKGPHWTRGCPYKDRLEAAGAGSLGFSEPEMPSRDSNPGTPASSGKAYVPPALREGGNRRMGESMRSKDEGWTIRVTNLSDDTREQDLQEMFRKFGVISRVHIARDKHTQQPKGFAFVNYYKKEDAEKAIAKMDKQGYDNLILKVDWSNKGSQGGQGGAY